MFKDYVDKLNDLQDLISKLSAETRTLFMEDIFLTWRWWLCFGLTVIPWILWLIFRKKESTVRLLFAGFSTMFISMLLDDVGVELNFWDYNVDFDAINPSFILWDMSVLPVVTMIFLQIKPDASPILKSIIFSGTASFIVEPLFTLMAFYDPELWRYLYSFPIYIVIYMIAHYCSRRESFAKLGR